MWYTVFRNTAQEGALLFMKTSPKYLALLALTALIWGGAFVARSER